MKFLIDLEYTREKFADVTDGHEILEVVESDNVLTVVQDAIWQAREKLEAGWERTYNYEVIAIRRVNADGSQSDLL